MAIGALTTVSVGGEQPTAPLFADRFSFPGDGSYPTGGTAGFEATYRAKVKANRTIIDVISGDCGDNAVEYDRANDKLKVRVISTGAEVANGVNLSGTTFNLTIISK